MNTKLIWITPDAEKVILYCARVSNPKGQNSTDTKLINYCIKEKHWSIFETASACFEVETSRAISAQILRHRSLSFQELSQRYAKVTNFEYFKARRQDLKNRQNSIDDMSDVDKAWFDEAQQRVITEAMHAYNEALQRGVAKEVARALLPLSSSTRLYINGTIRSWIHYLNLRTDVSTQLEHREVAYSIRDELARHLPTIAGALEWSTGE